MRGRWSPSASAAGATATSPTWPGARARARGAASGSPGPGACDALVAGTHGARSADAGRSTLDGGRRSGRPAARRGRAGRGRRPSWRCRSTARPPPPARAGAVGADGRRLPGHRDDARRHPMELLRPELDQESLSSADLERRRRTGARVRVAGMVVARQRPATAKGVVFMLLEDERGMINLVVPPPVAERHRLAVRTAGFVLAPRPARAPRGDHQRALLADRAPATAGPAAGAGRADRAAGPGGDGPPGAGHRREEVSPSWRRPLPSPHSFGRRGRWRGCNFPCKSSVPSGAAPTFPAMHGLITLPRAAARCRRPRHRPATLGEYGLEPELELEPTAPPV